jgi:CDP-glycerol glycerophosphotransferase (TagB/SpsB family)
MSDYRKLFEREGLFRLYPEEKCYREIIGEGSLLVTDYSSVSFDFAYLGKPLVYCQFDRSAFYSGDHTAREGYFDERCDGFGEVTETVEDTVDKIISYLESDCKPKEEYIKRKDAFFAFTDKENSKRIVEKILSIDSDSKR